MTPDIEVVRVAARAYAKRTKPGEVHDDYGVCADVQTACEACRLAYIHAMHDMGLDEVQVAKASAELMKEDVHDRDGAVHSYAVGYYETLAGVVCGSVYDEAAYRRGLMDARLDGAA